MNNFEPKPFMGLAQLTQEYYNLKDDFIQLSNNMTQLSTASEMTAVNLTEAMHKVLDLVVEAQTLKNIILKELNIDQLKYENVRNIVKTKLDDELMSDELDRYLEDIRCIDQELERSELGQNRMDSLNSLKKEAQSRIDTLKARIQENSHINSSKENGGST